MGKVPPRRSRRCRRNKLLCFFFSKTQQYGVQWHKPVFSQAKGIFAVSSKRFGMGSHKPGDMNHDLSFCSNLFANVSDLFKTPILPLTKAPTHFILSFVSLARSLLCCALSQLQKHLHCSNFFLTLHMPHLAKQYL